MSLPIFDSADIEDHSQNQSSLFLQQILKIKDWKILDFEVAFWEARHIISAPKQVHLNALYRKSKLSPTISIPFHP